MQPVGDEAVDLGAHHERPHTDRRVDRLGPRGRLGSGQLARAHLDEGKQVDRVEGVADGHQLGVRHVELEA